MTRGQCPRTFPKQPGVWMGVGSLRCPSRYVNKGRDVVLEIQRSTAGDLGFQMWLGQWRLHFRWVGMD